MFSLLSQGSSCPLFADDSCRPLLYVQSKNFCKNKTTNERFAKKHNNRTSQSFVDKSVKSLNSSSPSNSDAMKAMR